MRRCSNGIIYKITNLCNLKIYIGKFNGHVNFNNYWGSGILIKRAIKKFGLQNFKKEILEEIINGNLNDREKYWIKFFNSTDIRIGYNLTAGGDGGDVFTNKPEHLKNITRKKISIAHKGIKQSSEWIKNRTTKTTGAGNGMFGKKLSQSTLQKISKKLKGRIFTGTHRNNMRTSKLGKNNPVHKILENPEKYRLFKSRVSDATRGSKNPRAIAVDKLDLEGNFIESYGCIKDAALLTLYKYNTRIAVKLSKAVDEQKEAFGFLWRYKLDS